MDEIPNVRVTRSDKEVLIEQANILLKYFSEQCLGLTDAIESLINDKARAVHEYAAGPRLNRIQLDIQELTAFNNDCRRLNKQLSVQVKAWASPEGSVISRIGVETMIINELYITMLGLHSQLLRSYGSSPANETLIGMLVNDARVINNLL